MQVIGNFNKISNELKATIKPLKGTVTFQMLTGAINNDPDKTERDKYPWLYPVFQIPTKERIKDPYLNNGKGGVVEIGVVENFDIEAGIEKITPRLFAPGKGEPQFRYLGKFSLQEGKLEDEEVYEYLQICNENRDNPHRNVKSDILFYEINPVEESKGKSKKFDNLREALNLADRITEKEMEEIAASLNWPKFHDKEVLISNIQEYAKIEPEKFVSIYKDPSTKDKAIVKKAFDAQLITFNPENREISMGNQLLTKLKKGVNDPIVATNDFLESSRNGKSIIESIKKQLQHENAADDITT